MDVGAGGRRAWEGLLGCGGCPRQRVHVNGFPGAGRAAPHLRSVPGAVRGAGTAAPEQTKEGIAGKAGGGSVLWAMPFPHHPPPTCGI